MYPKSLLLVAATHMHWRKLEEAHLDLKVNVNPSLVLLQGGNSASIL